jgi:hypothetical protein
MWPAITSVTPWLMLLYGMCVRFAPVRSFSISPARPFELPRLPAAKPKPPGTRFECSTSSATLRTGSEGCATMKLVEVQARPIGVKSRTGS